MKTPHQHKTPWSRNEDENEKEEQAVEEFDSTNYFQSDKKYMNPQRI